MDRLARHRFIDFGLLDEPMAVLSAQDAVLAQALPEIVDRWRLEMRARAGTRAEVNANAIRVTVDLQGPVIFDVAQLQQVLGNLLDNAWRYCSRLPGAIRMLAHALDQHHAELIVCIGLSRS